MHVITRVQTRDGAIHENAIEAQRYLNNQYGNLMERLSHRFAGVKFSDIGNLLEESIPEMEQIVRLRSEMDAPIEPLDFED